jgi:thioredoxin
MKPLRNATETSAFEATLESVNPVIVDFYTPSCVICKKIEPMLSAVESDFDGRLDVVKVDAAANLEIAAKYHVQGVPTLLLFRNGEPLGRKTGFVSATALRDWVKPFLQ